MMTLLAILGLIVSWGTGAGLVWALWPGRAAATLKVWLALAAGLAVSAGGYYVALRLGLAGGLGRFGIDALLLIAALAAGGWRNRDLLGMGGAVTRRTSGGVASGGGTGSLPASESAMGTSGGQDTGGQATSGTPAGGRGTHASASQAPGTPLWLGILRLAVGLGLLIGAAAVYAWTTFLRHGFMDAWYFWNTKARFMYRQPEAWERMFTPSPLLKHPDYPLLWPSGLARLWGYAGTDAPHVAHLLSGIFALGVVGVLYGALRHLRSAGQACVGVLAFLALDVVWFGIYNGYVDTPLALMMLSALAVAAVGATAPGISLSARALASREPAPESGRQAASGGSDTLSQGGHRLPLWFLAGLFAGAAAWTKNEGLPFCAGLLLAAILTSLGTSWRRAGLRVLSLALGLLPFLVLAALVKAQAPVATDLLAGQGEAGPWAKLADPQRHLAILQAVGQALTVMPDNLILFVLLAYALVTLRRPPAPTGRVLLLLGITLAVTLAGYYAAYLITPYNLQWHLQNSLLRLVVQVWPALVLAVCLAIRTPEQALHPEAEDMEKGRRGEGETGSLSRIFRGWLKAKAGSPPLFL